MPAGQFVQAIAPSAEYVASAQSEQALASVTPTVAEYLPAPQAMHAEPASEYVPAMQSTQSFGSSDPDGELLPVSQLMQVPGEEAPVAAEYVPAPQLMQVPGEEAPVAAEYVPAPQLMQVPGEEGPVAPEYVPAPQSEQASEDTVALYLPAAHDSQFCASGPVWPAGHPADIQSSDASLPAGEVEPALQAMQWLME